MFEIKWIFKKSEPGLFMQTPLSQYRVIKGSVLQDAVHSIEFLLRVEVPLEISFMKEV